MTITIRDFHEDDIPQMTDILNEIIEIGGTTAYLDPISHAEMAQKIAHGGEKAHWSVAINEAGDVVGFQWAAPHDQLPPEAATIASFVRVGVVGGGIGSKLFDVTKQKMKALGYEWLNASIRSDNTSGLTYYSKMGFKDWKIEPDASLSDGSVTGKHHKRFDL